MPVSINRTLFRRWPLQRIAVYALAALLALAVDYSLAQGNYLALGLLLLPLFVSVFVRPELFLLIFIIIAPFYYIYGLYPTGMMYSPHETPLWLRGLKDGLFSLLLVSYAAGGLLRKDWFIAKGAAYFLLFLFIVIAVLEAVRSSLDYQSFFVGMLGLKNTILYLPVVFIVKDLVPTRQIMEKYLNLICALGVVAALIGLAQGYFIFVLRLPIGWAGDRIYSTLNDPNMCGAFLGMIALLMVAFLLLGQWKLTWGRLLGLGVVVLALHLAVSMSSLIGFYAGLLFLLLYNALTRRRFLFLIVLPFLVPALLLFPPVNARLTNIASAQDYSASQKGVIMERTFEMFAKEPLIGNGFGMVGSTGLKRYQTSDVEYSAGENYYLIALAQFGLIGGGLFILILLVVLRQGLLYSLRLNTASLRVAAAGLTAAVLNFSLANNLVDHFEGFPNSFFFWFFVGVMLILKRLDDRERPAAES